MDHVLVTGGLGAIGRWTIERLAANGWEVTGIDLAKPEVGSGPDGIAFRAVDLTDQGETWESVASIQPEAIIHTAGVPGGWIEPESRTFETNVESTYNVLMAAGQFDAKVVWTSTTAVYGYSLRDASLLDRYPIDETFPARPLESYGLSKLVGEDVADMVAERYEIPIASIRPTWVHHPGDYADLRSRRESFEFETAEPLGLHSQYVDVRDVVSILERALTTEFDGHEVFVADAADNSLDVSTEDYLRTIFGEVPDCGFSGQVSCFSTEKAKELLDWAPKHSWRGAEGEQPETSDFVAGGRRRV